MKFKVYIKPPYPWAFLSEDYGYGTIGIKWAIGTPEENGAYIKYHYSDKEIVDYDYAKEAINEILTFFPIEIGRAHV